MTFNKTATEQIAFYAFHHVLIPGYLCPDLNYTLHMVEPTKLDKHRTGDNVTFRCAPGYILSGSKSITCRYVQHYNKTSWDSAQSTCIG